jgi:hypothetical protein
VKYIRRKMNEPAKVQVLTAGGAAGKHKRRNRHRGKGKKQNDSDQGKSLEDDARQVQIVEDEKTQLPPQDNSVVAAVQYLEYEDPTHHDEDDDGVEDVALSDDAKNNIGKGTPYTDHPSNDPHSILPPIPTPKPAGNHEILWLVICFFGIMASFVCYGLLLEYTTSGGRKLHELSFLFVTSGLYTLTAAAGRYVRDETPTTIPPARFAILGLTSMGSTWCSVRSLRYVQ